MYSGGVVSGTYNNAKISNVICNVDINATSNSGGIIGRVLGNTTISNVYYNGSVVNSGTVGGIVGNVTSSTTLTCQQTIAWKPQANITRDYYINNGAINGSSRTATYLGDTRGDIRVYSSSGALLGLYDVDEDTTIDDILYQIQVDMDIYYSIGSDGVITFESDLDGSALQSMGLTYNGDYSVGSTNALGTSGNININSIFGNITGFDTSENYVINGVHYGNTFSVTIDSDETIGEFFDRISAYGITGSLSDGQISLAGSSSGYITTVSANVASDLGFDGNDYTTNIVTGYTNSNSDSILREAEVAITTATALSTLGFVEENSGGIGYGQSMLGASADIEVLYNGEMTTITVTEKTFYSFDLGGGHSFHNQIRETKISDVFSLLSSYGIDGAIDENGRVVLTSNGGVILSMDDNLANCLGLQIGEGYSYEINGQKVNTDSDEFSQEGVGEINLYTTIGLIGLNTIPNPIPSVDYTVEVMHNGSLHTVTVNSTDTVGDMFDALDGYGIIAKVENGLVEFEGSSNSYIVNMSSDLRNLLKLNNNFNTTVSTSTTSNTTSDTFNVDTTTGITGTTVLNTIDGWNNGNGSIRIHKTDGTFVTISVNETGTLQDFFNSIAQYGLRSSVNSEGQVTIIGTGNVYLESIEGGSNILSALNITSVNSNTNTVTTNRTSSPLRYTTTVAATGTTTLEHLAHSNGTGITFTGNSVSMVLSTTSDSGSNTYTLTFNKTDDLYDVIDSLATCGIEATVDLRGQFSINASALSDFTITGELGEFLMGSYTKNYGIDTMYNISTNLIDNTSAVMSDSTTLSELGITNGNIVINQQGVLRTVGIDTTNIVTVGDFRGLLSQYGLSSHIDSQGRLNVYGVGNTTLQSIDGGSNILSVLGLENWDLGEITQASGTIGFTADEEQNAARETLLSTMGVTQGEYYIYNNGVKYTAVISADETLGSFMTTLERFGLTTGLLETEHGTQLTVIGYGDSYLATSNNPANASNVIDVLFQQDGSGNTIISSKNNYSGLEQTSYTVTTTVDSTKTNTVAETDAGMAGKLSVTVNGNEAIITIDLNDTIEDVLNKFRSVGLIADFENGQFLIQSGFNTLSINQYIPQNEGETASNLYTKLNYYEDLGGFMSSSETVEATTTNIYDRTLSVANLANLDTQMKKLNISEGSLSIYCDGYRKVVNIEADDTLEDFINKINGKYNGSVGLFNANDVDIRIDSFGNLEDGYLTFYSNSGKDIRVGVISDSSNFSSITGIAKDKVSGEVVSARELYCVTKDSVVTQSGIFRNAQQVLSGTVAIKKDGATLASYTLGTDKTIDDFVDMVNSDTSSTNVHANWDSIRGKIVFTDVRDDSELKTDGLELKGVSTGTFKVGDATITIEDDTTIADIVNQINNNTSSQAYAYWDSVKGEFVITSTKTGASFVNIEAGTSNFTDVVGFTITERNEDGSIKLDNDGNTVNTILNVSRQELGQNAKFSINGTSFTSSSNTITSEVSRIQGLTINLKGATKGETVTLKVEKDSEYVANTIESVVESYNSMMESIEEAIDKDTGLLNRETTLKMLKQQLQGIMTSANAAGSAGFINLSSVGISTSAASMGNVSTSKDFLNTLYFDKEAFLSKYKDNSTALKELLVGNDVNNGVFGDALQAISDALRVGGSISITEKSYTDKINKLNEKIKKQNSAIEAYRKQLEAKFKTMDMMIGQMNQQYSSFLNN